MPDAGPRISVVIPNHNRAAFLAEAIDSVFAQTLQPFEVIVVDDGSTDDSDSVRARYEGRVHWIGQPRSGVSSARNRGIAASRGELVAFLDADDAWLPEKLERQAIHFRDPDVGVVCCGIVYVDRQGRALSEQIDGEDGWVLEATALLRPTALGFGSTALVRRVCFDRLGGFHEALTSAEDWDMCRRIVGSWKLAVVRAPLLRYRQHPGGQHLDVDTLSRSMSIAFARMFSDPDARAVHHLRRRAYARLHVMLAGSYVHVKRRLRGAAHLVRAIAIWPPMAVEIVARVARRHRRESHRRIADVARRG